MTAMTPEQLDTFLRETRIAKLATLNGDGSPNVVPVWFEWTGSAALMFTTASSAKVRRIEHDARVALSVEEPVGVDEAWATIEGEATVEQDGAWDLISRLTPRYYSPEKAAKTLPAWERMKDEWVVIRITPTRIRSSV